MSVLAGTHACSKSCLDRALAENRRRGAAAVAASGTTLTAIAGISDVLAAKILGHIGDISRFPGSDHLASYAGTAPMPGREVGRPCVL